MTLSLRIPTSIKPEMIFTLSSRLGRRWGRLWRLLSETRLVRELIPLYGKVVWDLLPETVLYAIALRRVPIYAALFDELRKHGDIATELRQAIENDDQQP